MSNKRRIRQAVGLFLLLIMAVGESYAQPSSHKQDSVLVFSLLENADRCFDLAQYDSSLYFAREGLAHSKKNKYVVGEVWSIVRMNDALLAKDSLDVVEKNNERVYQEGIRLKDSTMIGVYWLHKGEVKLFREQLDSAIIYFERALHRKLERLKISYTGLCYNELGYAWGRKDNEDKMLETCMKGFEVYESIGHAAGCAMTLGNIATIYGRFRNYPKAIEFAKRSLVYRLKVGEPGALALVYSNLCRDYLSTNLDSSAYFMEVAKQYALQSKNPARIADTYITAGVLAGRRKQTALALENTKKALQILEESKVDPWLQCNQYISAAYYAAAIKADSAEVFGYYRKALKIATDLNSKHELQFVYDYLSEYNFNSKDYEQAYINFKKYILYKDSLEISKQQENIAELETRYETAKKDIEIERLSADQRIKQLEIEKQQAVINGNLLEAQQKENEINLLLQQRLLQDLRLKQQEEELVKQQLQAKNKEQELQLVQKERLLNENKLKSQKQWRNASIAGSVLLLLVGAIAFSRYKLKKKLEQQTAMQSMRNNIASDLHDDIGASLSNINILNELTRRNSSNPQKVGEYLSKASEDIRQVSEGISDIVWNINPRYDNLEHLFVRMKRYASDILDGKNINYSMQFPEDAKDWTLGMDKRRDLYLLFKEAVNNMAKYSKATHASIQLAMADNQIRLSIHDNGTGFDQTLVKAGNGLQNMKQRADLLKGKFLINSAPGSGTRLELEMPVS